MKEDKFTKGDWVYDPLTSGRFAAIKSNGKSILIFRCEPRNIHDVNIILAAPDSIELARLVMDLCGDPKGISDSNLDFLFDRALAFLKKAGVEK